MPYVFSEADTQEGAELVIDAWRDTSAPHHRETLRLKAEVGRYVELVLIGEAPDPKLIEEVNSFKNFTWNDIPAEGYHRDVRLESRRASAEELPSIYAGLRMRFVEPFLRECCIRPNGERAVHYEWIHYKRLVVVPTGGRARVHRGEQGLAASQFAEKFYRLGGYSAGSFDFLGDAFKTPGVQNGHDVSATEKMRFEFANEALLAGRFFSVLDETTGALTVFQVVRHVTGKEQVVHTHASMRRGHRIFYQPCRIWAHAPGEYPPSWLEVYYTGEPLDEETLELIGPFSAFRRTARMWTSSVSDIEGCTNLTGPTELSPGSADEECRPLLVYVEALEARGWVPVALAVA